MQRHEFSGQHEFKQLCIRAGKRQDLLRDGQTRGMHRKPSSPKQMSHKMPQQIPPEDPQTLQIRSEETLQQIGEFTETERRGRLFSSGTLLFLSSVYQIASWNTISKIQPTLTLPKAHQGQVGCKIIFILY